MIAGLPSDDPDAYPTLADYTREVLKRAILTRALSPGTRLTETAVAQQLGVSRLPVREALQTLSSMGLVVINRHGRGASVARPTAEMTAEIYAVRAALEATAAESAATQVTSDVLEDLAACISDGRRAIEREDWEQSSLLGSRFHLTIASSSGNRLLERELARYDELLRWANAPVSSERGMDIWDEHARILDALRAADPDRAFEEMRLHTRTTGRAMALRD